MVARKYSYHGEEYTITQLAEICGRSTDFIRNRINRGWSVEDAVDTPKEDEQLIPDEYAGKALSVCFREPLASVFPSMQPKRNKQYIAYPANPSNRSVSMGCKAYFIVTLENGKRLIVYPHEFRILGLAKDF